jgi:hypothetical protein
MREMTKSEIKLMDVIAHRIHVRKFAHKQSSDRRYLQPTFDVSVASRQVGKDIPAQKQYLKRSGKPKRVLQIPQMNPEIAAILAKINKRE